MMWKASVNAICARAHGTGFTSITRNDELRVRGHVKALPARSTACYDQHGS